MDRKELSKLKKAIKNMKSGSALYIAGKCFSCCWNGYGFTWTVNGRVYDNCTVKDIITWIDKGQHITSYCYDY